MEIAPPLAQHDSTGIESRLLLPRDVPRWWRVLTGFWKLVVGVICTQNFLTSILLVGWVYRLAQRTMSQYWWKSSAMAKNDSFRTFAQINPPHQGEESWPNWFWQQDRFWLRARTSPGRNRVRAIVKAFSHSLWLNLVIGVQGVFNTLVLTLPGCALMLFSWYAGWQNSFNKGYEQAAIGPLTGVGGILLFIGAMFYVPMAQMRQASSGEWRSFFEFKTVWILIRKRWLACCGLALLFSVVSVPVTILKTAPQFFPQINPALAELPPEKAFEFARTYFLGAGVVFFGAYLLLRVMAAKLYASAVLACVQSGQLGEESLAEREWKILQQLGLLTVHAEQERHFLVRSVAWCGTRLGRAAVALTIFVAWFAFTGQIYVSEFLMKSDMGRGWLNQPLVQMPWFNYIPSHLKKAAKGDNSENDSSEEWRGRRF